MDLPFLSEVFKGYTLHCKTYRGQNPERFALYFTVGEGSKECRALFFDSRDLRYSMGQNDQERIIDSILTIAILAGYDVILNGESYVPATKKAFTPYWNDSDFVDDSG